MGTGPAVATATVRIIPDTTGFRAALQAEVAAATRGMSANIASNLAGTTSAAGSTGRALRETGGAGKKAAEGMVAAKSEANALRGALIGLSRVTPVTVFGLGPMGVAAIAVGLAIKSAVSSTSDFEHQLYVLQATTQATTVEMAAVSKEAKALGADLSLPSTSAGDAARAMTELAKGGLSVRDTLDAARGTLQLAAAANIDVGTAAQFVVTELNAFGLAGTQATHVADLLAGASIAAQGDIRDFGTAFQQVSAVSRQTGVDVETTTGALTELARAGLKGADAGTSLRTFLLRLTPTTKQAQQYMDALGISYDKTKTIGSQLGSILDQLQRSTNGLNEAQKTQALTQIFGQDAIRSASILIREGSAGLRENTDAANQSGAANRLAQANAQGLSGAVNGLKSNLDTLGITLGGIVQGPMTDFVVVMGNMVGAVTALAGVLTTVKWPDWLGGSTADKWGKNIKDALLFYPLVRRVYFPKAKVQAIETPADKKARLDAARIFAPSVGGFSPAGALDVRPGESLKPEKNPLPPLSPAAAAAEQRRVDALNKSRRKVRNIDITAPNKLQIAQLNAQLANSLQDELKADQAIEHYFSERLKLAVKGTDRYTKILAAETAAHSAAAGVQSQIDAEAKSAAADAKAKRDKNIADAKQARADEKAHQLALFNLEKSKLDLRIQAAGLTKPITDDIRFNRAEIRFYNAQIARINAIKKRRKLTLEEQQAVVDYRTAIIGLRATIQSLKKDTSSGFSLNDLFKEATSQFNEFASNVSSGPSTPGGARGAVAGAILAQRPGLSKADALKLAEAATTNSLLADILAAVEASNGEQPSGVAYHPHLVGPGPGHLTAKQSRRLLRTVIP